LRLDHTIFLQNLNIHSMNSTENNLRLYNIIARQEFIGLQKLLLNDCVLMLLLWANNAKYWIFTGLGHILLCWTNLWPHLHCEFCLPLICRKLFWQQFFQVSTYKKYRFLIFSSPLSREEWMFWVLAMKSIISAKTLCK